MSKVSWDGSAGYEMVLATRCDAPPAAVYDVLADLSTHLEWAGRQQRRGFRLTSLTGGGIARVGTEFSSTGTIPMSRAHWDDRNVVMRADPPAVLEFHTESTVAAGGGRITRARWEHRYQIDADGAGSRVTYRLRRSAIENPPLRMRLPLVRTMTHRVMIPFYCRRGVVNLARAAEQRATQTVA